eukprot:TRINITY_DN1485_c0_g1_i1.p1 TRINITY_DN1485_c0_g1~~TRINITY_DN1485_c0_g1_i1.p1  ORF type:complete len:422 (-),score=69.76 TRINITY_DN1485_c0_g1_i1:42-1307(-)
MVKSLQENSHGPPGVIFDGNILDAKVTAKIGWFNREGRLRSPIQFMKVASSLGKISSEYAMDILNSLSGCEDRITDPTEYICSSAQRCFAETGGAPPAMPLPSQGSSFNMAGNSESGERWKTILCRHFEKGGCQRGEMCQFAHGAHELKDPSMAAFQGDIDKEAVDPAIRSAIAKCNKHPQLAQTLHFRQVAPVLAILQVPVALELLEELYNNIASIKNPTTWLAAAGKRRATGEERPQSKGKGKGKGGGKWDGGWGDSWGSGDAWEAMGQMVSQLMGSWDGGGKGSWGGGNGSWDGGKGSWDGGKGYKGGKGGGGINVALQEGWTRENQEQMIRKAVGHYNAQGDLQSPIMFRDISPILLQMEPEAARSVLASFNGRQHAVNNPTKWLTKAAMNYGQERGSHQQQQALEYAPAAADFSGF